jgi:hypothetical protein
MMLWIGLDWVGLLFGLLFEFSLELVVLEVISQHPFQFHRSIVHYELHVVTFTRCCC